MAYLTTSPSLADSRYINRPTIPTVPSIADSRVNWYGSAMPTRYAANQGNLSNVQVGNTGGGIDWEAIAPYLFGGGATAIDAWSAHRQASAGREQGEREAFLVWSENQRRAQQAEQMARASAIENFLNAEQARYARDMDYTQYNPFFQQEKEGKLQLARAFGGQMSPYRISPSMQTSGGAIIPEGGINLDALAQPALDAARADFDARRNLALTPPQMAARQQQIMDRIGQMNAPIDRTLYPFPDQLQQAQGQPQDQAQDGGGGAPWWRRALGTVGAAVVPFVPGLNAFAPVLSPARAAWGAGGGAGQAAIAGGTGAMQTPYIQDRMPSFLNPANS